MACLRCVGVGGAALAAGGYALYRYGAAHSWTVAAPDAETMGIVALTMGDAAAFFSAYNPSLMTAGAFRRKGGTESELSKRDLYRGATVGTALALLVAAGGSMVTASWWPVIGTAGVCGVQWGILYHVVEHPWGDVGSIAHQPPGGRLS